MQHIVPTPQAVASRDRFRLDINGLRAWAVMAVILYHFDIPGITGGFIGVDVFFVISGLLITKIIINKLEHSNNKNSTLLWNFYYGRIKRIVPPLLALCLTLLAIGWFCLGPREYRTLGEHVISAISFFSNFQLQQEAGYFDSASQEKWLLHTWSLAVECQFYLIFPLILLAIWKIKPSQKVITAVILTGFLTSFIASIHYTGVEPSKAFYFLPMRAWEMLAGSLTFLFGQHVNLSSKARRAAELSGLMLIILSIIIFNKNTAWPGGYALVPVLGTALVLIASRNDSIFTSNWLAQWLGNRSYSLYLWHWPVVVGLYFLEYLNVAAALSGLIITILLGHLSFELIEGKPKKNRLKKLNPAPFLSIILIFVTISLVLGKVIVANEGFPTRLPEKYVQILNEAQNFHPRRMECHIGGMTKSPECTYGGDQLGVVVIGDSHAASIMTSVTNALPDKKMNVLHWTFSACPTFLGVKQPNTACAEFVSWAMEKQKTLPRNVPVIIMNETSAYVHGFSEGQKPTVYFEKQYSERSPEYLQELREGLINAACEIAKHHPVFMVRPIPEMKSSVPVAIGRAFLLGKTGGSSISMEEYRKRNDFAWEAQNAARQKCGITILDPLPYLCHDGRCYGSKDGWPVYYDDNHLSERGANLISPLFREVFRPPNDMKNAMQNNN